MTPDVAMTMSLLERTPASVDSLLRGLPDAWTMRNEGERTWTVYEVMEHLVHCERVNWMARVRMIVEEGEARAFAPLDREVHAALGTPLGRLLDDFSQLRKGNLVQLGEMRVGAEELGRRGLHPTLGPVTLSELLATWAVHDMTHLHQISRVLAHQYREAVGLWRVNLGVLQCNGRSAG